MDLPPVLDPRWPEQAIADCAADPQPVALHAGAWRQTELFGEGRLLQWVASMRDRALPFELHLDQALPVLEDAPHHDLWRRLRDELAMALLVDGAARVLDPGGIDRRTEIREMQWSRIRGAGGEISTGRDRTLVAVDRGIDAPRPFRAFTAPRDNVRATRHRLYDLGALLGLQQQLDPWQWDRLALFAREAIENTRDHARDDLSGESVQGFRFAQVRRREVTRHKPAERLATDDDAPLHAYLERLVAIAPDERSGHFAELTIADTGVGIPARLLGDLDVYGHPLAAEVELTLRAMRPDESSKAGDEIGRGQGLANALHAARRLRGVVVVRTGRLELTRDTTLPSPAGQDGWHIAERAHAPGTTISLLLPWWSSDQEQLDMAGPTE